MPKSLLPPAVWCHGAQSTITGGSSRTQASVSRTIAWLAHHMRCVLITAFGAPVGADAGVRRIDLAPGLPLGERVDHLDAAGDSVEGSLELLFLGNEDQTGRD